MAADDISILCAVDAEAWASFIKKKLTEDQYNCTVVTKTILANKCEDLDQASIQKHKAAKAQVLLISPTLVDALCSYDDVHNLPDFFQLFPKSSKSVAVYCGCEQDDEDLLESVAGQFRNFYDWARCSAGQAEFAVKNVLVTILQALERDSNSDSGICQEDDVYAIPPPPRTVQGGRPAFRVFPDVVVSGGEQFTLLFDDRAKKPVVVELDDNVLTEVIADEINPYAYTFKLPELKVGQTCVKLKVFSNLSELGSETLQVESKLDRLKDLLDNVINPFELLGTALGLNPSHSSDVTAIDLQLKQVFKTNCPNGNFQDALNISGHDVQLSDGDRSDKETPTLLHFAARFGLKELCAELLSCPGAARAFTIENVNGDLPNDIAARAGHDELAKFLTDYMVVDKCVDIFRSSFPTLEVSDLSSDLAQHTGLPILMVYEEMITKKSESKRLSKKNDSGSFEAATPPPPPPPPPCPGGSYVNMGVQGQKAAEADLEAEPLGSNSLYMDMQQITSAQRGGAPFQGVRGDKTLSASTGVSSTDTIDKVLPHPCRSHSESETSSGSSRGDSPVNPRGSPVTDNKSTASSSLSYDGTDGTDVTESVPTSAEARPSNSSPTKTMLFCSDKQEKATSTSTAAMSEKDQELRNILQSANEGAVSLEEAKRLVNIWGEQYRTSQSTFHGKWTAIKSFKSSSVISLPETVDKQLLPRQPGEPMRQRKNSRVENFLHLFKRKSNKSSRDSAEHEKAGFMMKKKYPKDRSPSSASEDSNKNSYVVSEANGKCSPDQHKKMTSLTNLARKNSIRISRALEDRNFSNLPKIPQRNSMAAAAGSTPDTKPHPPMPVRADKPFIKIKTTGDLFENRIPEDEAVSDDAPMSPRRRLGSVERPRQSSFLFQSSLSPRLPEPSPPKGEKS